MGYYKVLSVPILTCDHPHYKGLYRSEPPPKSDEKNRFMELWERSIQNYDKIMGMTTELTIDEMKEFACLATQITGDYFEVIFFSEYFECPHQSEYYGIDVAGFGGYSMVGENFFTTSVENGIFHLTDVLNQYFRARLNSNGLFSKIEDAASFRTVLYDLNSLSPGYVEEEDWRILHIFRVK